jgi:hypothetical protein
MAGPIQIGAPDGSIVEFPGGTSDDVIKSAMAKAYPPPPQASAAVTPQATQIGLRLLPTLPRAAALASLREVLVCWARLAT